MSDDLEKNLRDSLHRVDGVKPPTIDVAAARQKADATRRQRRSAVIGAAALVAVVVVGGLALQLQPHQASDLAGVATDSGTGSDAVDPSLESGADAPRDQAAGGDIRLASPDKVNPCGQPIAEPVPSQSGLAVQVAFAADASAGSAVEGEVIVTNTSSQRVTGTTSAAPYLTLAENGVTVWHTNGVMIALAVTIDLAPGESMRLPASFDPVRCGDDDEQGVFRDNLPALPAGAYTLSGLVPFTSDDANVPSPEYILSDPSPITLR